MMSEQSEAIMVRLEDAAEKASAFDTKLLKWNKLVLGVEELLTLVDLSEARTADDAAEVAKHATSLAKEIEEQRKEWTAPMVAASRMINETLKPLASRLKIVKSNCVQQVDAWQRRMQAEANERARLEQIRIDAEQKERIDREAAERERVEKVNAELAAKAEEHGLSVAIPETPEAKPVAREVAAVEVIPQTTTGAHGRLTIKKTWKWRVVDVDAIPRHFMMVDEKNVNVMKPKAGGTPPEIPGIEWYEESIGSVR